jgi:serine/threonine protein kinase/tetratricopeptide (TPR) repeat protein
MAMDSAQDPKKNHGDAGDFSLPPLSADYWLQESLGPLREAPADASMSMRRDGSVSLRPAMEFGSAPSWTVDPAAGRIPLADITPGGDSTPASDDRPIPGPASKPVSSFPPPPPPFESPFRKGDSDDEGTYELDEALGRGGQGEVWSAIQSNLHREVALKIQRHASDHVEFLVEAYTSAELEHPNILPIHDLRRIERGGEKAMALAMKRARGLPWNVAMDRDRAEADWSLEEHLSRHLRVLAAVCNAVAFAHSKKLIHRDLKPQQVVVGEFGEAWLLDWGLAISMDEAAPLVPSTGVRKFWTLGTASACAGTPAYMAPEQAAPGHGRPHIGFHTDIYLLGATLHAIVAGRPPHSAPTGFAALQRAAANDINPLPEDCPSELAELLRRAMSANPAERPASAAAFREEVEGFLEGVGRRRESASLARSAEAAERAIESKEAAAVPYADFQRVERDLDRALALWDANAPARAALERIRARHAAAALARGDLALASDLAGSLEDGPPRADLAGRIDAVAARRRQAVRQRRQLAVALAGLLLAYLASVSWLYVRSEAARKEAIENERRARLAEAAARRDRDLAEERRRVAEVTLAAAKEQGKKASELTLYVLDKLKEEVDERLIGGESGLDPDRANELAHAIAGGVAEDLAERYRAANVDDWPEELRLEHADHLVDVGRVFEQYGRYDEYLELSSESLRLRRQAASAAPSELATSLLELGHAVWQRDQNREESMRLMRQALATAELEPEPHPVQLALIHNGIGLVLLDSGQYEEAKAEFEAAASPLDATKVEAEERILAKALANLGACLRRLERPNEAIGLLNRSLEIRERLLEPNDPELAEAYSNLASGYVSLGRHDEAIQLYLGFLEKMRRKYPPSHPLIAGALGNVASAYVEAQMFDEGVRYNAMASEAIDALYGPDHAVALTQLGNSAVLLVHLGRDEEAMPMFLRYRDSMARKNPPNLERVAYANGNIAFIHYKAKRWEEASRLFAVASDGFDEAKGPEKGDSNAMRRFLLMASTWWARELPEGGKEPAIEFVRLAVQKWEARPEEERAGFSPGNHARWAEALSLLGRGDDAREVVQAVVELDYPNGAPEEDATAFLSLARRLGVGLPEPEEKPAEAGDEARAAVDDGGEAGAGRAP